MSGEEQGVVESLLPREQKRKTDPADCRRNAVQSGYIEIFEFLKNFLRLLGVSLPARNPVVKNEHGGAEFVFFGHLQSAFDDVLLLFGRLERLQGSKEVAQHKLHVVFRMIDAEPCKMVGECAEVIAEFGILVYFRRAFAQILQCGQSAFQIPFGCRRAERMETGERGFLRNAVHPCLRLRLEMEKSEREEQENQQRS